MSDCKGFTLKRVRDMIRTYSLHKYVYRKDNFFHVKLGKIKFLHMNNM